MNYGSEEENAVRDKFVNVFKRSPLPDDNILANLGLFLNSKTLSRLLFMDFLYRQAIDVQGVIMDFGTRWGQNMSLFAALRGIYEPFNRHKKIIGFDTFAGFPLVGDKDGKSVMMKDGNVTVTEKYLEYLDAVMRCQEGDNPLGHIKKYDFVVGDACKGIHEYLEKNPETIVAMAFFDFDLYEPTKACLEAIKPRLVKGSVLGFDELNDHDSPGETRALMEVFGLNNVQLRRYRYASRVSYFVVE
ncbi:crotonobetainyl-CoA--carnitine CoA-transferase [Candidatus Parcubacteria bacterium]|nr:MAG: crotonobetainyl-CoA--carnitine CoA-transferase [Candidatus Parcubacteria bacterium]